MPEYDITVKETVTRRIVVMANSQETARQVALGDLDVRFSDDPTWGTERDDGLGPRWINAEYERDSSTEITDIDLLI